MSIDESAEVTPLADSPCIPVADSAGCNSGVVQPSPENLHSASAQTLESEVAKLKRIHPKEGIRWPKMGKDNSKTWEELDKCVTDQLPSAWSGVDVKVRMLETVLYEEGSTKFGIVEVREKVKFIPRRQKKIMEVRRRLNDLKKAWKLASELEQLGIDCLQDDVRKELRALRKAEHSRQRRWRRKNLRSRFYRDPYGTAREVFNPKVRVQPDVSKAELNEFMRRVCEDPFCKVSLDPVEELPLLTDIKAFDDSPFSFAVFNGILKRKRNGSKHGINGNSYKPYKKCPRLARYLFSVICKVRKVCTAPLQWRISNGIHIPKVDSPSPKVMDHFRQIALMNVEGKLFWSLVAHRLYQHLVEQNKLINTSSQKGSIRKMAGVWEHISMVWSALKDARLRKKSLVVIWLDLANAYGSVPHALILFALKRYNVPPSWITLIMHYFCGLWGRTSASGVSSDWFKYEKGIFAGCTVSVIIFLAAFNILLELIQTARVPCYKLHGSVEMPLLRGFMDDLTLMTVGVPYARLMLRKVQQALLWSRMAAKGSKSRSCVIKCGRSMNVEPFTINEGEIIPSIQRIPIRFLGRMIDGSLADRKSRQKLLEGIQSGLKRIDKSLFTGVMKLFTYQSVLLMQTCWSFMIYELPLSWVSHVEGSVNVYLRKWLGVSKSMSTTALFCRKSPCPLPITSLSTEFKSRKAGALIQLQESVDPLVSNTSPSLYCGRKWDVDVAVQMASVDVRVAEMIGKVEPGRGGLGLTRRKTFVKRKLVTTALREQLDEELFVKATRQSLQGQWTKWGDIVKRDMSFHRLLRLSPQLISFCLGATFNTLATPTRLKKWGYSDSDLCSLCQKHKGTVPHILSGCPVALADGRYRYRHDSVLKSVAHAIQQRMNRPVDDGGLRVSVSAGHRNHWFMVAAC